MARLADNETDRLKLRSLYAVTSRLRELDAEMPIQQQVVLMWVALNEGKTQRDLRTALDMASSTASRNLTALSEHHRLGKPGLGLIELRDGTDDRRVKEVFLTQKGTAFMGRLLGDL